MKILTGEHIITGNEYFRQKAFCPYDSDNYAVSTFICKWTSIKFLIGGIWKNRKLKDLDIKDNRYPSQPSFLNEYEFIEFDDENEKNLVSIYNEDDIKEINKRMFLCYKMTWDE